MKIAMAADDAGRELKDIIKADLIAKGYEIEDFGLTEHQPTADYPDYAEPACRAVAEGRCERGILVCGTGIGMSIAANKMKGIRAAALSDCFTAEATRMHNNANVLCLGERTVGPGLACKLADIFLETGFQGGRHQTRLDMITEMENE